MALDLLTKVARKRDADGFLVHKPQPLSLFVTKKLPDEETEEELVRQSITGMWQKVLAKILRTKK